APPSRSGKSALRSVRSGGPARLSGCRVSTSSLGLLLAIARQSSLASGEMGLPCPSGRSSEGEIAQPGPMVLALDRCLGHRPLAVGAQAVPIDIGQFDARSAVAGGNRVVELVIPLGLKSLLFKLAVVLKLAEGLGSPVQIALSERHAALA